MDCNKPVRNVSTNTEVYRTWCPRNRGSSAAPLWDT